MKSSELYNSFLEEFPLVELRSMTLEKYTNLNRNNSFCYWLEVKTAGLGSIWGGSSYKFGIYRYNVTPKRNDGSYLYDNEYAWLAKYGKSRDEAFEKIKNIIWQVANAADTGNFAAIDGCDLGDAFKWKIAFLYSRKNLVSIFNPAMLRIAAEEKGLYDAKSKKVSEVQQFLLDNRGGADIFDYSYELLEVVSEVMRNNQNTWLYAPGNAACLWDDFYKEGVMAIGWDDLGVLSEYKNQSEIHEKLRSIYITDKGKSNDAKACWDFCNKIKPGDIVIAKKGTREILGYGVVESEYDYDETDNGFRNRRKVSWKQKGNWDSPVSLPQKTLTLKDEKFRDMIMNTINSSGAAHLREDDAVTTLLLKKKQIILQGAPGTGKTYRTVDLAVSICNPEFREFDNRDALMEEYNRLKGEGLICFTTFHQSMDYEEFVEGLKPVSGSGGVSFELRAGLFKEICDRALLNTISLSKNIYAELEFDDLYDMFISLKEKKLETKTGKRIEFEPNNNTNLRFRYLQSNNRWSRNIVSKDRLRELYLKFNTPASIANIKNIDDEIRAAIGGCDASAYWAVLKYIVEHKSAEEKECVEIESLPVREQESVVQAFLTSPKESRSTNANANNHVLIIDEINRGNISKILGELITLLEADKRIGEINELTAKLPYSQKVFGVPSNLYIIGTMNTADRSVGYIDYAIRRRFAFVPLLADPLVIQAYYENDEELKNVSLKLFGDVKSIIDNINPEFGADDLMIGHSYFMAGSVEELEQKLTYEIKPLLREYANDGIVNLSRNENGKYERIENLSIG